METKYFPDPDEFKEPIPVLDYSLLETQGGFSFSEANFFQKPGKMIFKALNLEQMLTLRKICEAFQPVKVEYLDYNANCILSLQYEEYVLFKDYYNAEVELWEVIT